jgi:S-adenosylmethionine:tRNA ribosyltransferase-isomerase
LKVSDFDFELPDEAIAQTPAEPRDAARLLVHRIAADGTEHAIVRDLPALLSPGDLLVLNDARVRPARVFARRATGGSVELLLLGPLVPPNTAAGAAGAGSGPEGNLWRAMVRPARKLQPGAALEIEGAPLRIVPVERELDSDGQPGAIWQVALECGDGPPVEDQLESCGRMPLPPYIRRERGGDERDALDRDRYQTVYAQADGAVAAPTAGLHFTHGLLDRLRAAEIEVTTVSLMVGLGTFLPMTVDDTAQHHMHAESFFLPQSAVRAVDACRARGGRVIAVGTTSVRVLEACSQPDGGLAAGAGSTDIFIQDDYRFRTVDGLLTNFHLPKSTLVMLVGALAGRERVLGLYADAIERGYRFYSYGDAMLLLP